MEKTNPLGILMCLHENNFCVSTRKVSQFYGEKCFLKLKALFFRNFLKLKEVFKSDAGLTSFTSRPKVCCKNDIVNMADR